MSFIVVTHCPLSTLIFKYLGSKRNLKFFFFVYSSYFVFNLICILPRGTTFDIACTFKYLLIICKHLILSTNWFWLYTVYNNNFIEFRFIQTSDPNKGIFDLNSTVTKSIWCFRLIYFHQFRAIIWLHITDFSAKLPYNIGLIFVGFYCIFLSLLQCQINVCVTHSLSILSLIKIRFVQF